MGSGGMTPHHLCAASPPHYATSHHLLHALTSALATCHDIPLPPHLHCIPPPPSRRRESTLACRVRAGQNFPLLPPRLSPFPPFFVPVLGTLEKAGVM